MRGNGGPSLLVSSGIKSVLRNFNSIHLRVIFVLYCASLYAGFPCPFATDLAQVLGESSER